MIIHSLEKRRIISPPQWLADNCHYLVTTGSVAYGAAEESSDQDIQGFAIPPKGYIFPHLNGEIPGFGKPGPRFDVWQEHHAADVENDKQYDFAVYSIVRFFQLTMENNPNMIDLLFVPDDCVRHITHVGQMVRDARKMFLHKGAFVKLRGYAFSQLHKMSTKTPTGKRLESVEQYGYDVKFAYHIVRLMLECEQLLMYGEMDLRRDREVYKSIRRGEWTEDAIRRWFADREEYLDHLYQQTTLPDAPREDEIKALLLACLEEHYGSLANVVSTSAPKADVVVSDIVLALRKGGYI